MQMLGKMQPPYRLTAGDDSKTVLWTNKNLRVWKINGFSIQLSQWIMTFNILCRSGDWGIIFTTTIFNKELARQIQLPYIFLFP